MKKFKSATFFFYDMKKTLFERYKTEDYKVRLLNFIWKIFCKKSEKLSIITVHCKKFSLKRS